MRRLLTIAALLIAAVLLGVAGYRHFHTNYEVETTEDGVAVARVVTDRLTRAARLHVSTLSGVVQSTSADSRAFGLLNSDRVYKAPFAVEYFVDAGALTPARMYWNAKTRTLLVDAPDVIVGRPTVDAAHGTLVRTRGLLVTRDAMETMMRNGALKAERLVAARARDPEIVAKARENARTALADLLRAPLGAAGMGNADVVVRFPNEHRGREEQWDITRSLEDILSGR